MNAAIERLHVLTDKISDTAKVLVPNGAVLGVIHLVDVKAAAELVLVGLSIAYTIWRWRRDSRRRDLDDEP